jgi:hypothetical protein
MENFKKIEQAKKLLAENGYYIGNLWSVTDVKENFKCTDEEAYEVLDCALQNDATKAQIWFSIDLHARELELKENITT